MQFNLSALLVFALAADALITVQQSRVPVPQKQINSGVVVEHKQPIKNVNIKTITTTKKANLQVLPSRGARVVSRGARVVTVLKDGKNRFVRHVSRHKPLYTGVAAATGAFIIATLIADHTKSLISTIYRHGAKFFKNLGNTLASYAKKLGDWVSHVTSLFFGFVRKIMTKCGMEKVAIWTDKQWQKFKNMMIKAGEAVKRASNKVISGTKKAGALAANGATAAGQTVKGAAAGVGAKVAGAAKSGLENAADSVGKTEDQALKAEHVADEKAKEANKNVDAIKEEALGEVKEQIGKGREAIGQNMKKAGNKLAETGEEEEIKGEEQQAEGELKKAQA